MHIELNDRSEFKDRMKDALEFDKTSAAVITIDLQREYLDESVGQSVVEPEEAARVMKAHERLLDACRGAGIPIIHAYAVRRQVETEAGFGGGGLAYLGAAQERGLSQAPHRPARTRPDRPAGAPESEVPAELVAPTDIHVTEKKSLDSFFHTDLGFLLDRVIKPKFVINTGINTDTCVYSTTFTAANKGYSPIVISDCVASMRGRDSHEMALELMSRSIAWVLSLDESVGQSVVEPDEAARVMKAHTRLLDACRGAGIPVIHAYAVRRQVETGTGFGGGGLAYLGAAQERGLSQAPHRPARTRPDRPAGAPESEVPAELVAPTDIHVTEKKSLDSFAHTDLGFLLDRVIKPKFVINTGINTDTCVYSTTFTAANKGYAPIVISDCVASMRGRDSHEMALELMSRSIAWVLSLDEFLDRLEA